MQYLIATTSEVVHLIALRAVHFIPLQEVHLSRYWQFIVLFLQNGFIFGHSTVRKGSIPPLTFSSSSSESSLNCFFCFIMFEFKVSRSLCHKFTPFRRHLQADCEIGTLFCESGDRYLIHYIMNAAGIAFNYFLCGSDRIHIPNPMVWISPKVKTGFLHSTKYWFSVWLALLH